MGLLLKKTLRTLYHSSKRIFVFVPFVVLFKEFCSLYFHDKHCTCFVSGRKRNPRVEALIKPNWVVRSPHIP